MKSEPDFIELLKNHCLTLYPRCTLNYAERIKETNRYNFYKAEVLYFHKRTRQSIKKRCWICLLKGTQTFAISYHRYLDNGTIKYLTKVTRNKFIKLCTKKMTM